MKAGDNLNLVYFCSESGGNQKTSLGESDCRFSTAKKAEKKTRNSGELVSAGLVF
jgi:hypothetical protein